MAFYVVERQKEKDVLTPEDSKRVANRVIEAIERIENKAILLIEEFDAKIRYEGSIQKAIEKGCKSGVLASERERR